MIMVRDQKQSRMMGDITALKKQAIRRRFLDSVSSVLALLVFIGLPVSLSRISQTGIHFNHFTHIFCGLFIFILFVAKKRLSDRWVFLVLHIIFFVLSISAFIQYGMVSAGFYFAAAAIFVTSMSMGLQAGMICTAVYGLIIASMSYLWISGHLAFPGDANQYIRLGSVWATLGAAFLITTAILFISAAGFLRDLTELLDTVDEQKRKIEERSVELTRANRELEKAMKDIKTLSGLLPICSNCKKIRDDQGYWQQVEQYLENHSQATFTHALCPGCIKELYPDIADKVLRRMDKS